jgi:DNA-binding CsgD family transcriptional regulator/sugar-specific transcriptional regulator TrmB
MLTALGLTTTAESVYRLLLDDPGAGVSDIAERLGASEDQVRNCLDQLFHIALLRDSADEPGRIHVVDPTVALQQVLADQQADLARRQQQVAESQAAMACLIEDFGRVRGSSAFTAVELLGLDAVRDRLHRLATEVQFELLTFMPGGAQSPAALELARRNDTALLQRDVQIRTVGLESIRNDPATLAHARFLTDGGAEFRTSAILPPRMVLADRRAALVPLDPDDSRKGALYVTGFGIIATMLALFEQVWRIATPLGAAPDPQREGLSTQERALLTLLADGLTDEAAAGRLGISHRTTRRMMSGLMERLNARSRFEAGLKAAQRGWL